VQRDPAGIRRGLGRGVERALEPMHERRAHFCRRLVPTRRRHLVAAQLADRRFEDLGLVRTSPGDILSNAMSAVRSSRL
jgi:hypothetical protein